MKKFHYLFLLSIFTFCLAGCNNQPTQNSNIDTQKIIDPPQTQVIKEPISTLQSTQTQTETISTTQTQQANNESLNQDDPFQYSETSGYYGTLTLTGYLHTEKHVCKPGDMCEKTIEYASFMIPKLENEMLKNYLKENEGNSFVRAQSIGLGCYEKDQKRIYSTNESDNGEITNIITGADLTKLLNSNAKKLVKLQLTKPVYTSGMGAPECYSHFRSFKVLK